MPSSVALIKGYLPVRLKLPDTAKIGVEEDFTFFYVKEHQTGTASTGEGGRSKSSSTLFVANAPVVPGISTKILLKSIFGRYADVSRVTVVQHPREMGANDTTRNTPSSTSWSTKLKNPSFLPPAHSEGKFAHVVFSSSKNMRRALKALHDAMRPSPNSKNDEDRDHVPGITLEKIEIQTLSDETDRQYEAAQKELMGNEEDRDDSDFETNSASGKEKPTGILAVAAQYRASLDALPRSALLEECNAVMEAFERAEEESKRAQEVAKAQPDDDGFITVAYTPAVGSKAELEDKHSSNRRRGTKRNRKKKDNTGADELTDFYRFQRRDNRKRTIEDLRKQFEEDLKKVKKMKDERHYRPF